MHGFFTKHTCHEPFKMPHVFTFTEGTVLNQRRKQQCWLGNSTCCRMKASVIRIILTPHSKELILSSQDGASLRTNIAKEWEPALGALRLPMESILYASSGTSASLKRNLPLPIKAYASSCIFSYCLFSVCNRYP